MDTRIIDNHNHNHNNSSSRDEALQRLSSGVTIKNRRYRFRIYKNCFVGSEAVDFMVNSGWAKSREEAVIIGQRLQNHYHLFVHVCDNHIFQDGYLFYRFIETCGDAADSSIIVSPPALHATISGTTTTAASSIGMNLDGSSTSLEPLSPSSSKRSIALSVGKKIGQSYKTITSSIGVGSSDSSSSGSRISKAFFHFDDGNNNSSSSNNIINHNNDNKHLKDDIYITDTDDLNDPHTRPSFLKDCKYKIGLLSIGEILHCDIQLYYKHSTINDALCFPANEAIDFMISSGLASTRTDAIQIGRALQRECFIESVDATGPYMFRDARLFFAFCGDGKNNKKSNNNNNGSNSSLIYKTGHHHDNNHDEDNTATFRTSTSSATSISTSTTTSLSGSFATLHTHGHHHPHEHSSWEETLEDVSKKMILHIPVQDQTYHLKVYPECFIGREAVSIIVDKLGITSSRRDAVLLGRAVMYEYQLFEHVTRDHVFDDEDYFYKFKKHTEQSEQIMQTFRELQQQKHQSKET